MYIEKKEEQFFLLNNNWKETLEYINKNLSQKENFIQYIDSIMNVVTILIKCGSTYENSVLNTAMLQMFIKFTNTDYNKLNCKYDKSIVESIKIFNQDQNWESHINNILKNSKYKYLSKIELSIILNNIRESKKNKNETKLLEEKKKFLYLEKKYENKLHNYLFAKIKEELK